MNNKLANKQISIQTIIDVANYFEDYKERYDQIFLKENEKNKDKSYSEKDYEYENGNVTVNYTIEFHNGQRMTESDYNWFIGNLSNPRMIKVIDLDIHVSYYTKSRGSDHNDIYNKVSSSVEFRDASMNLKYSDVTISVDTTNQESEARNIYSTIMNTLEDTPDRFDNTIKHRKLRIQSFCISVGIILSYLLYVILIINKNKLPVDIATYLNNKNIIVFGQWFVAILLGNVFSYWYMLALYRPILPDTKYAGYNSSTYKSVYKDDVDDYLSHSEVHIGKFWDAEARRNKIEKLYKITSKIVLAQVLISIVLYLILK